MRKLLYVLLMLAVIVPAMMSCSGEGDTSREDELRNERDSLLALATSNQRDLERMTMFFNEVSACIDSITEQESILVNQVDPETNRRYSRREVARRLSQLEEIISGQRNRIDSLMNTLNDRVDTTRTRGLRSTIQYLTSQLEAKEAQIARLQEQIRGHRQNIDMLQGQVQELTGEVEDLNTRNNELEQAVTAQTEIINEGYVLIADKERLRDLGIIEGGGFLRRTRVNLNRVSREMCSRVNMAQMTSLPIPSTKVKVLSPVPEGSYSISKSNGSSTLTINNPTAFWSLSSVLVIQTE
ncbi:MAG: hypothetical protein J6C67_03330 [Muribaculaceae bacterium]|nr:hypothetical protein [Muribaculaceae bacterium]